MYSNCSAVSSAGYTHRRGLVVWRGCKPSVQDLSLVCSAYRFVCPRIVESAARRCAERYISNPFDDTYCSGIRSYVKFSTVLLFLFKL